MRVVIVGPIRHWHGRRWNTVERLRYFAQRDMVHHTLVASGHLVYAPYQAWKGQWEDNAGDTTAQAANDAAIRCAHVVVNLTPAGVSPAGGIADELNLARQLRTPVVNVDEWMSAADLLNAINHAVSAVPA